MAVNGYGDLSAYGWGRALLEDEGAGFGDEVSEDALPRYIDPLNDWGFKRLFGTEMNKEFLVAFLMTIFPDKRIKDITYLPTEQLGMAAGDRNARFDVMCRDESGEKFIIEVQLAYQKHFRERALYYSGMALHSQGVKGKRWNYNIKGVYFVGLQNFDFGPERGGGLIRRYSVRDDKNGDLMTDKLRFVFIEIDSIFSRFFEAAEVISLTKDEKQQYVSNMINERDTYNQIAYAREFGREEGVKQGLEQGKIAEREAIALRLVEANTPMDIIVKCTGLDKAAVEALAQQ